MGKEDNGMIFIYAVLVLSGLIFACMARVLLGPTIADRMIAVCAINALVVSILVLSSLAFGEVVYVDVAIVYAMLSFVCTLYVSKYLEENKE